MSRSPSPVAKTEKKEKDKKKKEKKKKRRRSDSNSDGEQSDSELNKKKLKKAKKLKKQAKPEKSEPDEEDTKSLAASEPKLPEKKSIKERLGQVNDTENQESASEVDQPNEKPLASSKVIQEPAHSPSPSPVTKKDETEVPQYKVSKKD